MPDRRRENRISKQTRILSYCHEFHNNRLWNTRSQLGQHRRRGCGCVRPFSVGSIGSHIHNGPSFMFPWHDRDRVQLRQRRWPPTPSRRRGVRGRLCFLLEKHEVPQWPGRGSGFERHAHINGDQLQGARQDPSPETHTGSWKGQTDGARGRCSSCVCSFQTKHRRVWRAPNTWLALFKIKALQQKVEIQHNATLNWKIR